MHEIGMLRLWATMEVTTGSFYYELSTKHPFYPIRGYVADLMRLDPDNLEEENYPNWREGAGSYAYCDECGKGMYHSFSWWDNNEANTECGAFYCRECDVKLCEQESGLGHDLYAWDFNPYERVEDYTCMWCQDNFFNPEKRNAHELTCKQYEPF